MKNVFNQNDSNEIINRINLLTPDTKGLWGKMSVAQMLAHCNVTYEMAYENIHPEPNSFVKLMLKLFVKKSVVGETPYKKSIQTAPAFIMKDEKDFEKEKERLINYIKKTLELGEAYFEGRKSLSFGALNKTEWNNMFYKHLDHHLAQFGV
ncbi:MAG: DUF1569 domain-containing protein [Bacteroidota bacterium]